MTHLQKLSQNRCLWGRVASVQCGTYVMGIIWVPVFQQIQGKHQGPISKGTTLMVEWILAYGRDTIR